MSDYEKEREKKLTVMLLSIWNADSHSSSNGAPESGSSKFLIVSGSKNPHNISIITEKYITWKKNDCMLSFIAHEFVGGSDI